jgi:hypothetical protein
MVAGVLLYLDCDVYAQEVLEVPLQTSLQFEMDCRKDCFVAGSEYEGDQRSPKVFVLTSS